MRLQEIYEQVAKDLGLPPLLVKRTYLAYWKVVKEHVVAQPFDEIEEAWEYNELRPNINIPSLGKLYVGLGRFLYKKAQIKATRERRKRESSENKE